MSITDDSEASHCFSCMTDCCVVAVGAVRSGSELLGSKPGDCCTVNIVEQPVLGVVIVIVIVFVVLVSGVVTYSIVVDACDDGRCVAGELPGSV